jgi:TolB-like protein/Flp pilus assembly protein TadD
MAHVQQSIPGSCRDMPRTRSEAVTARDTRTFRLGELRVEPELQRISGRGETLRVEPRVMDVLVALALRAPRPLSRDELLQNVWGRSVVTDGVLTRCIAILRELLGDHRGEPRFIETLPKRGYRLIAPVVFEESAGAAVQPQPPAPRIRLAVLPFLNLSGEAADEYLVDGLTELLITALAGIAAIRVIARTSSMRYKHAQQPLREIAEELAVDHLVEGSLLIARHQVQVVVQLIEAKSEAHIWARTYVREPRDTLTLFNEIARTVSDELRSALTPVETSRLGLALPLREDALRAYLRGRHYWAQRSPDGLNKALEQFESCVLLAPGFAPAYSGIVEALVVLALYGIAAPRSIRARALAASARALALDPESGRAQTTRGAALMFLEHDFAAAEAAFVRAYAATPNDPVCLLGYGDLLLFTGRTDEALQRIREAADVDPFDLGLNMNVGDFLMLARRHGEAVAQLERTLAMSPEFVPARLRLAEAYAFAGDGAAARAQLDRAALVSASSVRLHETRALVQALTGNEPGARALLQQLESASAERHVGTYELARAYAALDDRDAAFYWLDVAIAEHAPAATMVGVQPAFDPLRGDPRFTDVLRRVGLAAYLAAK